MTDQLPPPTEWDKQHWKEAERAHDFQNAAAELHAKQLEGFAFLGIRTLALTSAGGTAALLGFYSANYNRLSGSEHVLSIVNSILAMLFLSLLATLVCTLCGYFSQAFFTQAIFAKERSYTHPYVQDGEKTEKYNTYGNLFWVLSIVFALMSALLLCVAGYEFLQITRA